MADTNKETLVQKLTDIADGFRTSRSLTETLSLDDMATLAAVPISGGEGDKNLAVYTLDQFTFDGSACTNFDATKNKYLGTLLNGCIIPYSNGGTVIDTVRGSNPTTDGKFSISLFTGYDSIILPDNITTLATGCFNESKIKNIQIEGDRVVIYDDEDRGGRGRLFRNCSWLQNVDTTKLYLSENATSITTTFQQCGNLETININHWDTSNITDMSFVFNQARKLTTLNLSSWNISNVSDMRYMFQLCESLVDLDISNWDTSNVMDMTNLFYECRRLQTITGTIDMLHNLNNNSFFYRCYALKNVTLKNIQYSLSFSECSLLSNASILNTAQELWDKTGYPTQTLSFHANALSYINNTYVKLIPITAAMREQDPYIDNKKPCEVCESTDAGAMTLRDYILSKNWAIG